MGGFECERVDMKWLALCTDGSTGCHQGWQELSHSFLQFAEFTLTIDDAKEYVYSLSTKRRVYNWHDIRVRLYI